MHLQWQNLRDPCADSTKGHIGVSEGAVIRPLHMIHILCLLAQDLGQQCHPILSLPLLTPNSCTDDGGPVYSDIHIIITQCKTIHSCATYRTSKLVSNNRLSSSLYVFLTSVDICLIP